METWPELAFEEWKEIRNTLHYASSPEEALLAFFQSSYEASAALAGWDRAALEGDVLNLAKA